MQQISLDSLIRSVDIRKLPNSHANFSSTPDHPILKLSLRIPGFCCAPKLIDAVLSLLTGGLSVEHRPWCPILPTGFSRKMQFVFSKLPYVYSYWATSYVVVRAIPLIRAQNINISITAAADIVFCALYYILTCCYVIVWHKYLRYAIINHHNL